MNVLDTYASVTSKSAWPTSVYHGRDESIRKVCSPHSQVTQQERRTSHTLSVPSPRYSVARCHGSSPKERKGRESRIYLPGVHRGPFVIETKLGTPKGEKTLPSTRTQMDVKLTIHYKTLEVICCPQKSLSMLHNNGSNSYHLLFAVTYQASIHSTAPYL